MNFKNIRYFFRDAFLSLYRNRLLSFATVSTMAICILILGIAVALTLNAGSLIDRLESDVEIIVYIEKDIDSVKMPGIRKDIEKIEGISSISFISKEQGLKELEEKLGSEQYTLAETLDNNPLPNRYDVKADNPHEVPEIAAKIENISGVSKVNYGKGIVERLFKVTTGVRTISLVFIALLAFAAVFLIATTIRLSIFARRKEIYLMKLIGATDWYVSWPFYIEGVLLGLAGGFVAVVFLALGYGTVVQNIQASVFFIPMVDDFNILLQLYLSLLGVATVLGIIGTSISLRRFLNV